MAASTLFLLNLANAGQRPTLPPKNDLADEVEGWGIKQRRGFYSLGAIIVLDSSTRVGFLVFVSFLMIEKGVATEWAASAVLVTVFGGMCGKYAVGLIAERIGVALSIMLTEIATAALIVLGDLRYRPRTHRRQKTFPRLRIDLYVRVRRRSDCPITV